MPSYTSSMVENREFKVHPSSIPIHHKLYPEFFDGYQGKEPLQSIVTNVPISYESGGKKELIVIRLVNMSVLPKNRKQESTTSDRENVTMIYLGGGDSDGLANTSIGAHIRDAQNTIREVEEKFPASKNSKWDISTVLGVSLPVGAPRTEQLVDKEDVKTSAEIIYRAITQAVAEKSIRLENKVILMGFSNGGAIAIELGKFMGDKIQQLVLVEPAAMTKQPNLKLNFGLSAFRAYGADARDQGLNLKDTAKYVAENTRLHWTQADGAPEDFTAMFPVLGEIERQNPKHLIERAQKELQEKPQLRTYADLKALFKRVFTPDPRRVKPIYKTREEVYGVSAQPTGLNTVPLGNDTTYETRRATKEPVLLVESADSKVVNPRRALGDLPDNELVAALFPNSRLRNMITVPGNHHGLGDKPELWRRIIGKIQAIPLTEKAAN